MAKRDPSRDHDGFKAYVDETARKDRNDNGYKGSGYLGIGRLSDVESERLKKAMLEDESEPSGPKI